MMRRNTALPIGRTAKLAYEIENLRADCCQAAASITLDAADNEEELEECARLDEALASAHRLLKFTVRNVVLSRLTRRSRVR